MKYYIHFSGHPPYTKIKAFQRLATSFSWIAWIYYEEAQPYVLTLVKLRLTCHGNYFRLKLTQQSILVF
jgi:hypothetical protein